MIATHKNPKWWTDQNESSWDRVKDAFKRDWDQTKHDMGSKKEPETNQNVKHTVKQASGKETIPPRGQPAYEEYEPAYRFGYGARAQYGRKYSAWDDSLETELRRDWADTYPDEDWDTRARYIRQGWDYDEE